MARLRWEYAILKQRDAEHELSAPRSCWEDAGFPVPPGDAVMTSTIRVPFVLILNRLGQSGWEVFAVESDHFYLRRPEPDMLGPQR